MRRFVILGASQFGERLCKIISMEGRDEVIAFAQEKEYISSNSLYGLPVFPLESLNDYAEEFEIILGIGYSNMNKLRERLFDKCNSLNLKIGTYISTNSFVYSSVIGEGCFVSPGTVIGTDCIIGKGNFFESSVILSHDNKVGDFNFFSTNAVLGGFSQVKNNCFLGLHSTISHDITIGSYSLIGAAANVIESIGNDDANNGSVYVGNPAKAIIGRKSLDTKI